MNRLGLALAGAAATAVLGGSTVIVLAGTSSDDASRPGAAGATATSGRPAPERSGPRVTPVQPTSHAPSTQVTGTPDADPPAPARAEASGTVPVRVQIPSIHVDSALQPLGTTRSGALASPSQWQRAGWFAGGIRPGDVGPAVIAGHVDSVSGPAVFYRLPSLRPGASILVTRRDHRVLRFVVDGTAEYPKRTFPTAAVYGPTSLPVLRLVTCTGDFDVAAHSYVDNLVVTSHLVSTGGTS